MIRTRKTRRWEENLGDDTGLSEEDLTSECQHCGERSFIQDMGLVPRIHNGVIEKQVWCDTCIRLRTDKLKELI